MSKAEAKKRVLVEKINSNKFVPAEETILSACYSGGSICRCDYAVISPRAEK